MLGRMIRVVHATCKFASVAVVMLGLNALVMYQSDGAPVARYHLENAWPAKAQTTASATAYDASKNEVSIETLALAAPPTQGGS